MSSQDLLFFQGPAGKDLVFGDGDVVSVPPRLVYIDGVLPPLTLTAQVGSVLDAQLSGVLPQLALNAQVANVLELHVNAALPSLTMTASMTYDNSCTRYLQLATMSDYQTALQPRPTIDSEWRVSQQMRGGTDMASQTAVRSGHSTDVIAGISDLRNLVNTLSHQPAGRTGTATTTSSQTGEPHSIDRLTHYQTALRTGMSQSSRYQTGVSHRYWLHDSNWQPATRKGGARQGRSGHSGKWRGRQASDHWQLSQHLPSGREFIPPVVVPVGCYTPSGDLLFSFPADFSGNVVFQCGDYSVPPPVGDTVVVPVQRVYIVLNSASLRRVDGNIYLPTFGMTLNLDMSSWTWGFNATLPDSVLSSLEPSSQGAPVEVEATINGVAYRALVEGVTRSRSFGKSDITITARGKTSLLDAPYSPVQSFGNVADRTAAQLMDDVLSVNGQPMGWTVDFGLEDWLVPAGVFAHQGSYISALNAIANAAGGYVQPHATAQSLKVLPKYPSTPWTWASATPDYELPSSVTTTEAIEWVEKARYNRVYVSGVKNGVLGQVTRTGSDGGILAPMVTDSLITHTIAARQRGLSVLGDTGRIANVKLRLPVLAETGIITPGKMVRYVDGGTNRTGIVRSVGVEVGMPEVWQTIGVETHVN